MVIVMKSTPLVYVGILSIVLVTIIGCDSDEQDTSKVLDEPEEQTAEQTEVESQDTADSAEDILGMYQRLGEMYEQMRRHHQEGDTQPGHHTESMQQIHRQMTHAGRHHREMMREGHGMMGRGHHGRMHDHGGMMGEYGMIHPETMARWHEQMAQRHTEHARLFEDDDELDDHHRRAGRMHRRMAEMMHDEVSTIDPEEFDQLDAAGERIYAVRCASCHGTEGQGVTGAFPPLADSSVVAGAKPTLVRVVHDGLVGEIEVSGERYDSMMPGFGDQLSDRQIAAVLTYIRSRWAEGTEEVTVEDIDEFTDPDRVSPWRSTELGIEAPRGD